LGAFEFSVKIPAVEKEVHWTTCVFHEGPFCENGDPLDNLGFSKKVRTWSPIPTSKGLSNNKGKKAQKCANGVLFPVTPTMSGSLAKLTCSNSFTYTCAANPTTGGKLRGCKYSAKPFQLFGFKLHLS